ncbi:MAG: hypothetical protein FWC19_06390 [Treponema sp.]|nr:hypothetical protein [Treponema sp.]
MILKSFEVLEMFAKQLERNVSGTSSFKTKVVITPSSIDEAGVIIKLSLLKTFIPDVVPAAKRSRTLHVRVTVKGRAESMTGLKQATEAIEALDDFLIEGASLRLEKTEDWGPVKIPNSRITQQISEEDSFIDSPDSIAVQDVQDDRIVIITIPNQTGDD